MAPFGQSIYLPTEITDFILNNLSTHSLKSMSLVNKAFWTVCAPHIFRTIKIRFSTDDLNALRDICSSRVASYVRILHYEARELVDPYVQHLDYFKACIYTPQEYTKDQKDLHWDLQGGDISYTSIQRYFSQLAHDQHFILRKRTDIRVLSECVKSLRFLTILKLSFDETHHNRFLWFANRAFLDWNNLFPVHLETIFKILATAHSEGIIIKSLEISGFHAGLGQDRENLKALAREGLFSVTKIRLVDSFSLLSFLARLDLPFLRELHLENCGVVGSDLTVFIDKHRGSLRRVALKRVYLHKGSITSNSSLVTLQKLFELSKGRESYMLEAATLPFEL